MSYFALCTFDLKNASRTDYQNAYEDLEKIGLSRTITSDKGKPVSLPSTTTAGEFNGDSVATVREHLVTKVKAAFKARGFTSEIFILVGNNWSWSHSTT